MGKILMIGLDGGTWDLLKPWIDARELPTFKKLTENGCHGILKSTIPAMTCPAMPAFYTGKNPGKTGVFDFVDPIRGTLFSTDDVKDRVLWQILSDNDVKVCIFNVDMTFPPHNVNGVMISGSLTPTKESEFTYPPSLKTKHDFPIAIDWGHLFEKYPGGKLVSKFGEITTKRFQILEKLLKENGYEFVLFFVKGTDVLQHHLWNEKELILDYYKTVDKNIHHLMEKFEFRDVIIFSDHGFGPWPWHCFHGNTWLGKEGYLRLKGDALIAWFYDIARRLIPPDIITKIRMLVLKQSVPAEKGVAPRLVPGMDWGRSKAYESGSWGITIIRENLKKGEYEKLRSELINKLQKLKYKGEFVMREVKRKEEVFKGEFLDLIPDIVFTPNKGFKATSFPSGKTFKKAEGKKNLQGDHFACRDGIFIAYGSDIKAGGEVEGAELVDIAPLVLHMLKVPIPPDMDGKVPKEIFKTDSEFAKPYTEVEA